MTHADLNRLKLDVSIKAKNGVDFITAASLIWLAVAFIWTLDYTSHNKSVLTFIVGGIMLPLAVMFSKVYKTQWNLKDNPLQPLGLWLNFAQLFYFPFLIFILLKSPDHFVMTYAIITGAHFFPYAWFYDEKIYAVMAGVISLGALLVTLLLPASSSYLIPLGTAICLIILGVVIFTSYRRKEAGESIQAS